MIEIIFCFLPAIILFLFCYKLKQRYKIVQFNNNTEKIQADFCILVIEKLNVKDADAMTEEILQVADFSQWAEKSIVCIQNRLPQKQYMQFANKMGIELEEDELLFIVENALVYQEMIDSRNIIWQWELAK